MKYPTWPQLLFDRSSLTQKARLPVTWVLITWITPSTPVLGRAEASVEDAPTHHTELESGTANERTGLGLGLGAGVVTQTNSPPEISRIRTTRPAAFMQKVGRHCTLYTVRT
jgi:hypothetical protein